MLSALLTPGQVLAGKYRIDRLLGAGGMGAVYVATNLVLEKQVALKVMGGQFVSHPEWVARFFREGVAASRVRHPGVVQVFDAGEHDGAPWMAMELLEGESLRARLERTGRLSPHATIAIARQVLGALAVVHETGIVHRDLKPDNVFLESTAEGERAKVLDFGIAKEADAIQSLTQTGAVIGTAHYLAPEQARDSRSVDARTDLYAFGVMLFECLSGVMPYEAQTVPELIAKMFSEPPRDLSRLAPDVPTPLAQVVVACLAHDPARRPQNARALLSMIDAVAAGQSPIVPSTGPLAQPMPQWAQAAANAATMAAPSSPPPSQWQQTPAPQWNASAAPAWPSPAPMMPQQPMTHPMPPQPRKGGSGCGWVVGILGGLGLTIVVIGGVIIAMVWWAARQVEHAAEGFDLSGITAALDMTIWDATHPPMIADVNGDGHEDFVGMVMRLQGAGETPLHIAAFDGRTGTRLWIGESMGSSSAYSESKLGIAGSTILLADSTGQLQGFSLQTGQVQWRVSMGERLERFCAGSTGSVVIETVDHRRTLVSLADGSVQPMGAGDCASIVDAQIPYGSVRMSGAWAASNNTWNLRQDGMSIDGAWTDPISQRMLLAGQRSSGTATPLVAMRAANGTVEWIADVPGVPPLTAATSEPDAGAISDGVVFFGYEMQGDRPYRVTAMTLDRGQRLWDIEIPGENMSIGFIVAGAEVVLVGHGGKLSGFDRTDGHRLFYIGPPQR